MYSCTICSSTFVSSSGLRQHSDSIHKGIKHLCNKCTSSFHSKSALNKHKKAVHEQLRYSCALCDKKFMQSNNLQNHIRLHTGERPFECKACGKTYVAKKDLVRHAFTHSKNSVKKFVCAVCSMRFHENNLLQKHMIVHVDNWPYDCTICSKRFKLKVNLNAHLKLHANERNFKCDKCEWRSNTLSNLRCHMERHTHQLKFNCQHCEKRFPGHRSLTAHIWHVHKRKKQKQTCVFCEKVLSSGRLLRHIRQHTQEKPCNCKLCGKAYGTNSAVFWHMQRKHIQEKSEKCQQCDAAFISESELNSHVTRKHGSRDDFRFECSRCQKQFYTKRELLFHKKSINHTIVTCIFCTDGRKYYCQSEAYFLHIRQHTRERVQMCPVCQAEFMHAADCVEHFNLHTGEMPFKCGDCNQSFATKHSRNKHYKHNHSH